MIAKSRPRWHASEDNSAMPAFDLPHEPAARQAFDALLAIQMQLELATGVPVAIYGPLGQALPGISPMRPRQPAQQVPPAKDLLAPHNWPQDIGQMLEVISGGALHFFITPFVLCNAPIAQIILGPVQLFEPSGHDGSADGMEPPGKMMPIGGVPVLASWKAQAAAEIARTLVSRLHMSATDQPAQLSASEDFLSLSIQETVAHPRVSNTAHHQQALAPLRLGALAHDVMLPERTTAGRLQRVTESTNMIETPPEDQDTTPLWPAPPRPLSASLHESESLRGPVSLLRHVVEAMPQAVIINAAPDGHIVLANRAARALWPQWLGGLSPESETSAPLRFLVTVEDYPPEWLGLSIALRQAESFRGEVCVEVDENDQRPMLASAFPLRVGQEDASHAIATFEDLSGLMERELFKDELLLMAAHDVRNPLTLISSHAQLLERHLATELPQGQLLERTRARLTIIQEQVQQLTELTGQLSTVTHLQSAQQRPYAETVNLARLIQRSAIDQQMLTPERSIETLVEYDPCLVQADQTQLQLIFMNILKNAVRYSHPGKPIRVTLTCTPARTPLWAEVSVCDHGIGIPRTSLPHIFERFYRVSGNEQRARIAGIRPPSDESPGLGLGLYLCKQLLERMGGRIWADSVEGQGTTVSFALPLKR